MGFLDVPARPSVIAGKVGKGELVLNVKDFGAKGDGTTDDTAAIQAAINAATAGTTVYFPPAPSGYIITAGLNITTIPNIRFAVGSRDYGTYLKCITPGVTMLTVKASQFINELTFLGDGGIHGAGATVNGIDMFGDTSANQDCTIGGSFIGLNLPLKLRGRNADVNTATFSTSLAGIQLDGIDATYHTGAPADGDKRGNQIRNCRFHDVADKAIEVTATAKIGNAIIEDNFFDSGSPTRSIYAVGGSSATHNRLTIRGNKITDATADAISLTYCVNSTVRGNEIYGIAATTGGRGIVLDNCTDVDVSDSMITQVSGSGVVGTNNLRVRLDNVKVRAIGADTSTVGHGFDFNSTNTGCEFLNLSVEGADGWGFTGDPASSSIVGGRFNSCTLGSFNSSTMHNRVTSGRNTYLEGNGGRKQDYASKSYDLAAGAAVPLATITSGDPFSSFEVEVKVIGRNTAGLMYARYVRYVRPENGNPGYITPVSDVAQGTITLAFSTAGTSGVTVTATATVSTAYVTAHVTAFAGGGAASAAARGVTVAMA